jgi:hypothetical protein
MPRRRLSAPLVEMSAAEGVMGRVPVDGVEQDVRIDHEHD